ncbi:MAG: hypothetical protein IJC88_03600 [Oscillospiraceae bacterium]|nr:hypothetical protein [Oscillospiraceae bacterium]
MKRSLSFIGLPLFLGLCAAFLRATELSYAFDPETGLYLSGLSATPALMILSGVAFLLFSALAFFTREEPLDAPTSPVLLPVGLVCTLILLASAAFQIYFGITQVFSMTNLIQALFSVYAACAALVLCKKGFAPSNGGTYAVFAIAPAIWVSYTLILIYRDRVADPILLDYSYLLFAVVGAVLFLYALAGCIFGKKKLRLAVLSSSLTVFFSVCELLGHVIALVLPSSVAVFDLSPIEALTLAFCLIFIPFAINELWKKKEIAE